MMIQNKVSGFGSKLTRSVLAGVLAIGLMPMPAFADIQAASLTTQADPVAMSVDQVVIGAAHAAANPAPEILGLSNPAQRYATEGETTYEFFGNPEVNENPDPYLYNYHNNLTPSFTEGWSGSPMGALGAYDTSKTANEYPNAIWNQKPQVILGTGGDKYPDDATSEVWTYYDSENYARAVETANSWDADSYHPIAVTYNRVTLPTMIESMYRLAEAGAAVSTKDYAPGDYGVSASDASIYYDSNRSCRYGDPIEIARDYERYGIGQKGVVLKAIDEGVVSKKTIAVVNAYDSDAKTYTITTDGVQEGTATTNRYLEGVQGVTDNYFDSVGAAGETSATVTAEQLSENVDVIIVSTGTSSAESGSIASFLSNDGLLDRTFYCTDWGGGSAFGTTVNSVENAQNVGRILPCVYPEVLDQSDMVAYYYDVFYHIIDSARTGFIAEKMDGVRNWSKTDSTSYTAWEESDVSNYNHDNVEALLKTGVAYLNTKSNLSSYLTPTKYVAGDTTALSLAEVTTDVDSEVTTSVGSTFALGAKTNSDGTLSYKSSNESVATVDASGNVTVKDVPGIAKITVESAQTSKYLKGAADVTVTVLGNSSIKLTACSTPYTGKAISFPSSKVKTSGSTGKVTYSYYSNSACTKAVKAANVKTVGTYYVKANLAADNQYQAASSDAVTLTITQAANTVTAKKASVSKSFTAKKLASKAQTVSLPSVTTKFGTAKWSVSTKDKKGVLSLSSNKVKVKKGATKGTYTIKVKASVAKTANYKAASTKAVTVKVTVK